MSGPRKTGRSREKPAPPRPREPRPDQRARDAIAHEESLPGDRVRMTFRVVLDRQHAEALAARAIREQKNIGVLVSEILEGAVRKERA